MVSQYLVHILLPVDKYPSLVRMATECIAESILKKKCGWAPMMIHKLWICSLTCCSLWSRPSKCIDYTENDCIYYFFFFFFFNLVFLLKFKTFSSKFHRYQADWRNPIPRSKPINFWLADCSFRTHHLRGIQHTKVRDTVDQGSGSINHRVMTVLVHTTL